jgi:transcriptional regulator with XRE-family HTH domain
VTAPEEDERERRSALGKAIRLRRVEVDLTRADLAREADVSYTYVSEIENGTKQASAKTLWRIARALGLEPHELMAMAAQWETRPTAGSPTGQPAAAHPSLAAARALALPPEPPAAQSHWFHAARVPLESAGDPAGARPEGGPPELVDALDRIDAALDGVPAERAELALMLALDERRTRRIVREELARRDND